MNANNILISITRYIHAKYDYEINTNAINLPLLLKHIVNQFDDEVIHEYWQDYLNSKETQQEQTSYASGTDVNGEAILVEGVMQKEKSNTSISSIKRRIEEYKQERKARG